MKPQWTLIDAAAVRGSRPLCEVSCRLIGLQGNLVQFGGYHRHPDQSGTDHNDIHIFRPATNTWVLSNPTGNHGIPAGRMYHGDLAVIDDAVYLYGGSGSDGYVWRYRFPSECYPSANVRLADCQSTESADPSWDPGEGIDKCCRVEVFHDGEWGTVSGWIGWQSTAVNVVCAELGCSEGRGIRDFGNSYSGFSGPGSGRIWIDDVNCIGSEVSITECQHNGWGNEA